MAARQYLSCKHCGQKFISSDKTVLCGGKCKSLFHLRCIPLNRAERSVLSMSRNLWWLCDLCSNVDPGSIVSVLSGLISTISVLNKEISALKEVVRCSHSTLKNGELEINEKCTCQLSHKRTPIKNMNQNSDDFTHVPHSNPASFSMELQSPGLLKIKTESPPENGKSSPSNTSNFSNSLDTVSNVVCLNEIKIETPEKTVPLANKESTVVPIENFSQKVYDSVKCSRRSKRPTYKVNDFYYY
uniref:PHD-type domain-containing protein n=1 Tax=Rhodnius prolixus TaxID=13249 RepID=T1HHN4_RHOPR